MRRDSFAHFALVKGSNIPRRCEPLIEWSNERLKQETWSFCKTQVRRNGVTATYRDWGGIVREGWNFAAQDYLGLSNDERVVRSATDMVQRHGTHSAGSEVNGGTFVETELLATELSGLLGKHVVLFPTGWAAGYGGVRALVRPRDHVVLDRVAHNCLQEGALAATTNRHYFEHCNVASLNKILAEIRTEDTENAILVVTESLFSMDSDGPVLRELVDVAHAWDAYVLLDCAHDFGVFGPFGAGKAAEEEVIGEVDFVMGSFSKVLAATGGFFASKWRQCTLHVQAFGQANTFSNHLGPAQVGSALAALQIVRSAEGDALRTSVLAYAGALREALTAAGFVCLGSPSALIPVLMGNEQPGRFACRELSKQGVLANFIEYPAVAIGQSRLRLQVSPQHVAIDPIIVVHALQHAVATAASQIA